MANLSCRFEAAVPTGPRPGRCRNRATHETLAALEMPVQTPVLLGLAVVQERYFSSIGGGCRHSANVNDRVVSGETLAASECCGFIRITSASGRTFD